MPALNRDHGIAINRETAGTRWLGETMDYGLAVDALLQQRREAREGVRGRLGGDPAAGPAASSFPAACDGPPADFTARVGCSGIRGSRATRVQGGAQ